MVANLTREGGVSLVVDQGPSTILNKIKQNKSIDYNIFVTVRSKITTQFLALTIYVALAIYGLITVMSTLFEINVNLPNTSFVQKM